MADDLDPVLPFSHPIHLDDLGRVAYEVSLTLNDEQSAATAALLGVLAVENVLAEIRIKPERKDIYLVRGQVTALLTQECVVTLDPVSIEVDQEIDLRVKAHAGEDAVARAESQELSFFVDETDPPEPLVTDILDLGQIILEFLALGVDPYPRKDGAMLDESLYGPITDEAQDGPDESEDDKTAEKSPFAALAALQKET